MRRTPAPFGRFVFGAAILVLLVASAAPAHAQAIIKVSDTINIKFGTLLQGWADWQQLTDSAGKTAGYQQNLFIRRFRLLVGGQIAKDVTFFIDTENANLGKATATPSTAKALGTGFQLLDAFVEWKIANEFALDGGLILIPVCRNCNSSAASQLSMDYGTFSFQESAPTQSTIGRDTGFQAKGYLFNDKLEYRAGVFQGARLTGSRNALRFAARLQYDFLEAQKTPFYAGTYLGKKKVFALGTSYDTQSDYKSYAFDAFFDHPVGGGNAVTAEIDYIHYDGGTAFAPTNVAALYKQSDIFVVAGFYFAGPKLMPFARYEDQSYSEDKYKYLNKRNFQFGLTWYPYGHNFNIRAGYGILERPKTPSTYPTPAGTPKIETTNQFTIQVQLFYF